MPKLIIVAGLPGSGKSTLFDADHFGSKKIIDDLMANALGNCGKFQCSRHLIEIVESLRLDEEIVISDIRFCEPSFRTEVLDSLTRLVGPFETEWHCFENLPQVCKRNAMKRAKEKATRDYKREEQLIDFLSSQYEPFPTGATVHPVEDHS